MSGLHYSHKLPWRQLAEYYQGYKYPAITLPSGECRKIHVTTNKVKHQIKNKKFLESYICTDSECKTTDEREFRKKPTRTEIFQNRPKQDHFKLESFFEKLYEAIVDYTSTMKPRVIEIENYPTTDQLTYCDRCDHFIKLIETKNIPELEKYTPNELSDVFSCSHGGQAVGRNLPFLFQHVLGVYIITNIIYVSNNVEKQENWGNMKPKSYFREMAMESCDGQTFLPASRMYLTDEVYLKDLKLTKEMCKRCFEFISLYTWLESKFRLESNLEIKRYLPYFIY